MATQIKCPHCNCLVNLKELKMRSYPQLKYYWGVLVMLISDELGYSKDEVHEILKQRFLSEVVFVETKEGIQEMRIPKSTTSLTTDEFMLYLENIRQFASIELGLWIPNPGEDNDYLSKNS